MNINITNIKKDFFASFVVFLVALPLCIGIAIASGLSPFAGILSGIIGGIVVGSLSGSPLQVSGPAAGLIILIYEIIQKYGVQSIGVIILAAGLIQILFGLFNWGKWFRAISPAIIQGMLSGIGISILLNQFYIMLDTAPGKNPFDNIHHMLGTIHHAVFTMNTSTHHIAACIGALTIIIIMGWKYLPKKFKVIPGSLIAVIAASLIAFIWHLPIKYVSISGNIINSIHFITLEQIKAFWNIDFVIDAISIAFIASSETLLTSTAIDKMSPLYKTDYDKEILAQGVGNSIAGLIGAVPITGVIVRSAANIEAGGQTRLSAILHGFWILLFVTALPFIFKFIPAASLAAILVYTGFKLVNIQMGKDIFKLSKGEFAIYLITIIAILSTNLLEGILFGLLCGLVKNIFQTMKFRIKVVESPETNNVIVKIIGNLTFLRLPQIAESIEAIEACKNVQVVFDRVTAADHSIIDLLLGWSSRYIEDGGTVSIDWNLLKRMYPSFGWSSLTDKYPNLEIVKKGHKYRDCAKCKYHYNETKKED